MLVSSSNLVVPHAFASRVVVFLKATDLLFWAVANISVWPVVKCFTKSFENSIIFFFFYSLFYVDTIFLFTNLQIAL